MTNDGKEELAAYLEYNKILRSWFVAFGVGGPALFMINPRIGTELAENGELSYVSGLFLAGAGCQVSGALINKIGNWYVYRGANDSAYQEKRRFKFCKWLVHLDRFLARHCDDRGLRLGDVGSLHRVRLALVARTTRIGLRPATKTACRSNPVLLDLGNRPLA